MDLDELRALLAVAETGSISAAAKSLRFARATLRRRLDELEARVGTQLLQRDGTTLRPTPAGKMLVARAPKLLEEARALVDIVRGEAEPQTVHAVLLPGPPVEVLTMGLKLFFPIRSRVRFRCTFTEDPTQLPEDATFGMDIAEHPPTGPYKVRAVARIPVGLWATAAVAADIRSVDDLASRPLAVWRNREGALTELRQKSGERVPAQVFFESCDVAQLLHLAERGFVSYTPRMAVAPDASALVRVLPDEVGHSVAVHVLIPSRAESLTPVIDRVVRFLAAIGDPV